ETTLSGFTQVLTLDVPVIPYAVNHFKFAVEDTGDALGDSVVILRQGSLSAGMPEAFKPFRYVLNADTGTYDGNASVITTFVIPLKGPIALGFELLPDKVTLVNATGTTVNSVGLTIPAISVPQLTTLSRGMVLRVPVRFNDPAPPVFLSTFFEGYLI